MILIALGANLSSPVGAPAETVSAALLRLGELGAPAIRISRLYRSRAVPASDQPDFVNAVAVLETKLDPGALMALLHQVEAEFGRTRSQHWEARPLDLDLLAYDEVVTGKKYEESSGSLVLPHPRLQQRRFVLAPLVELAPNWQHPKLGLKAVALLAKLPPGDECIPLEA